MTNVSNPVAQLLNTGNLVVRDADADDGISYAWQGFDYPTDTMLAGMKVGVDFVTGLNRTLTAWTSDSDPSPSPYYYMIEVRGDPEMVLCEQSKKVWRSGPWNGLRFSGIPATLTFTGFNFSFINNEQEITYSFNTISSVLSKLTVNQSGALQRSLWVEDIGMWNVIWYVPMDQCDDMRGRPCGSFAACNPNNSPICDCIQGFTPKSPSKWLYREDTDGCVRKTKLDCKNGTDGFHVISNTKLADTSNASVYKNLSLVECKTKCLSDCSCTAYAPADVRSVASGCIIWTSELTDIRVFTNDSYEQDLYVRLAAIDLGQSSTASGKSSKWVTPFVIILVLTVLILACIGYLMWKRRKRRQSRAMQESNNSFHDRSNQGLSSWNDQLELSQKNDLELLLFDFGTIVSATENFSADNKLGQGGFGPVYKAWNSWKEGNSLQIVDESIGDTLTQGQYLTDGKTLISSGGNFALGFFSPTNSKSRYVGIWYNTISVQTVVWVANREKPILTGNGTLTISGNGSLIISDDNSTIYWSTPGVSAGSPIAQLLDTGNFVVREEWNSATEIYEWQSFDYPTDALLPGMKLGGI
ncbi:hypothetical protein J5N97_011878 [Dioscorea zingiberensis]|uniref:Uncharacterized protein n=1 Tax=Dioscorea zingiberensis TaxID=325984 RepID=A0A9D5D1Z3_9LILI|nr:hypothetical protein J5N97_011878 [Dioscorea zingiberensis]